MKKILRLQSALLKEIDKYEKLVPKRSHFIDWERVHITSCAKIGYMLAEERGVDPILAAAACAVHDTAGSSPADRKGMQKQDTCRYRSF